MRRMHNPPHPGAVLRDTVLAEVTVTELAKRLGVSRVTGGAVIRDSGRLAIAIVLSLVLSASVARPQEPQSDVTIDTVEVTAQREAVRKAIVTFVANITRRDGENVARWRAPICPSVAGATREQAEFIRSRIREVAASVDAPVGRNDKCKENLLVILTADPHQLWASWRAHYPKMFFAESQEDIKRAVAAARPVSVWQNAILNQADGMPIVWFRPPG